MRKWLYSLFEWTICFIMNNISSVRVGKGPIIKFLYQNEDVVCTGGPHKLWFSSQTDTLTDRCSSLRGFKVSLSLSRALDLHTCFFFHFDNRGGLLKEVTVLWHTEWAAVLFLINYSEVIKRGSWPERLLQTTSAFCFIIYLCLCHLSVLYLTTQRTGTVLKAFYQ